jgi:signal transduction histidine kinase
MANLEEIPPPPERKDELGILAHDVYSMYDKLKETISKLEDEILRERELEETQRYFFSVASHELKTPIAAKSVLLEGMLGFSSSLVFFVKALKKISVCCAVHQTVFNSEFLLNFYPYALF